MRNPYPKNDLCPVCMLFRADNSGVYCSDRCRVIAYNFRKRTLVVRRFLRELGFLFTLENGVQIKTGLPESFKVHYPYSVHTFLWPGQYTADLAPINAEDYWSALDKRLGRLVVSYIRWLMDKEYYHGSELVSLVDSFLLSVSMNQSFFCKVCSQRYIIAEETRGLEPDECADCSVEIPF